MDNSADAAHRPHNRSMLRLDPAHPPLWRTADRLQFGVPPVVRLDGPQPWQERMIAELERGLEESAWEPTATSFGAAAADAAALLERLRPALAPASPVAAPVRVALRVPRGFPGSDAADFAQALDWVSVPCRVEGRDVGAQRGPPADVVVLLSHHVVDPLAAVQLLHEDAPHVPVVFADGGARIGPLVRPGRTACAVCEQTHARGADPEWATLAAQLAQRTAARMPRLLVAEAALVCARMISAPAKTDAYRVTLRAGEHRRSTVACSPHPRCLCRSLGETATEAAPAAPLRVPTTWRASARRA